MTRSLALAAAAIAICIVAPSTARADDWSQTSEFTNAASSSIRVVEPEGYTVTIDNRTDTIPAVFNVPNAANYFTMTVKSPDGAAWSKKIEVKEYRQTVVRVKHVKAAPDAPKDAPQKPKAMSYVGTVHNQTNNCKADLQMTIRVDFLAGPDVVKSVELKSGAKTNIELVEGTYSVRRYRLEGDQWAFDNTDSWTVKKDGWLYEWGCAAPRRR